MSLRSIPQNTKNALDTLNTSFDKVLEEHEFYLAGGTALSLQIDHRMSYDLDFLLTKNLCLKNYYYIMVVLPLFKVIIIL